jgi:serine/threonine protein kinase
MSKQRKRNRGRLGKPPRDERAGSVSTAVLHAVPEVLRVAASDSDEEPLVESAERPSLGPPNLEAAEERLGLYGAANEAGDDSVDGDSADDYGADDYGADDDGARAAVGESDDASEATDGAFADHGYSIAANDGAANPSGPSASSGPSAPSAPSADVPAPQAEADDGFEIREEQREAIASILRSLTGSTLHGVADIGAASDATRRELIGQRVNNFEIIGLLSSGGMGDVFEAIHSVIQRRVAIKVLRREHCGDPALVQRFFNEARAANAIRHPNIVEVLDVGMLPGGLPYIAMERLEGETLSQRLAREGRLEVERALEYAVQAASALQAAHKRGIVHRDLKPDNLFIVPDPRVPGHELIKVLDFGIAKLHGDRLSQVKTNVGSILGTPPYMSPEQCRGIPDAVDHRSDVYALGVILFEMLCGAPPFVAEGVGDVMVMHLSSPPPLPTWRRKDIPVRVEQTILWALEKNPDQRIPSMGDFIFTLGTGPTPVPYIVTPTGLTTDDWTSSMVPTPTGVSSRYPGPAISLEGDFPIEDGEPTGEEVGYRSRSVPPMFAAPATDADRSSRPSVLPSGRRSSWRPAAAGALVATALSVAGFTYLKGGEPNAAPSERASVTPPGPAPAERLQQSTAALEAADEAANLREAEARDVASAEGVAPLDGELSLEDEQVVAPTKFGRGRAWSYAAARVAARPHAPVVVDGPAAEGSAIEGSSIEGSDIEGPALEGQNAEERPADVALDVNEGAVAGLASPEPKAAQASEATRAPAATSVHPEPQVVEKPTPAPEPAVATTGFLSFDSSPWARVTLNGRVLGVTPLRQVPLPVGKHQLRLENTELGISKTVVVEVTAGQTVSRFVTWD